MKIFILAALFLLLAAPLAYAQNDMALCKLADTHPAGNQGATYQPGVDVNGKPVVPADLGSFTPNIPDKITIPLTIDLAQRIGITLPEGTQMQAPIGTIDIYRNGKVVYNGQDLTDQVAVLCGKDTPPVEVEKPAAVKPEQKVAVPVPAPAPAKPEQKPAQDDDNIIWGEGH